MGFEIDGNYSLIEGQEAQIAAYTSQLDIVTEELVSHVFGMRCSVVPDPASGTPLVVPLGRHHV